MTTRIDTDSRRWLERLDLESAERAAAIDELHALLLKAARFEVGRRRRAFSHVRGDDFDDLANQAANDALVAAVHVEDDIRMITQAPALT